MIKSIQLHNPTRVLNLVAILVLALMTLSSSRASSGNTKVSAFAKAEYDLVFRGGRIFDGTGNPWFAGDVAVQGDRIVAVGRIPPGAGKREVDANGLALVPGFID